MLRRLINTRPVPPIVLLTDFGTEDHFVGTMKGVIASRCPDARVLDLSHGVRPQQVKQAAFLLWSAYRYFPAGTIFVAVADPGVGTQRRILLLKGGTWWFLAPDNGLTDLVFRDEHAEMCIDVKIRGSKYVLPQVSSTFHGRDVFAPLAAHLASGVSPELLGNPIVPPAPSLGFVVGKPAARAAVLHIDRFGNLITDIRIGDPNVLKSVSGGKKRVRQWTQRYAEAPDRVPCLMIGSSGLVEIAVRNGSAAKVLGWNESTTLGVSWA
jgi:S-adenosylmethionine hydrolase